MGPVFPRGGLWPPIERRIGPRLSSNDNDSTSWSSEVWVVGPLSQTCKHKCSCQAKDHPRATKHALHTVPGPCLSRVHPPFHVHTMVAQVVAFAWSKVEAMDTPVIPHDQGYTAATPQCPAARLLDIADLDFKICGSKSSLVSLSIDEPAKFTPTAVDRATWTFRADVPGKPAAWCGEQVESNPTGGSRSIEFPIQLGYQRRVRIQYMQSYEKVGRFTVWLRTAPSSQKATIDSIWQSRKSGFSTVLYDPRGGVPGRPVPLGKHTLVVQLDALNATELALRGGASKVKILGVKSC